MFLNNVPIISKKGFFCTDIFIGHIMKKTAIFILCIIFFQSIGFARSLSEFQMDYSRLVELIKMRDKEEPFYIFNKFEDNLYGSSCKTAVEYFNAHPGIVKKLKSDLEGREIKWEVKEYKQRLLFVPETRKEYSDLYENYCNHVVKYILNKTKLNNPYIRIQTLGDEQPDLINNKKITAFLVHNLAQEFNATFVFFNQNSKKIKVELNGRIILGEVGSYSSFITFMDNGGFKFTRNNFTVWQNSAENPYTALMTPVEETLHILLRENTERMIKEKIDQISVKNMQNVQNIADEWISVEEAVVGGLVYVLFQDFAKQYLCNLPASLIDEDIETKYSFCKYKYLKKGISLVKSLGYEEAIRMYREKTKEFITLLKS